MKCTGDSNESPHEFMRALWNRRSECCGPLLSLRPDSKSVAQMTTALEVVQASHVLIEADQLDGSFSLCAAHWFDTSMVIGGVGESHNNDQWKSLRRTLFAITCHFAGWDYREMYNRMTSHYKAKTGGYESLGVL